MTVVADLVAVLDSLVASAVYRDSAPDESTLPYVTVGDTISAEPILAGDARSIADRRLVQIDVWEARTAEDDTLVPAVRAAVDGLALTSPGLRARVSSVARLVEDEIVHHAITVRVAVVL